MVGEHGPEPSAGGSATEPVPNSSLTDNLNSSDEETESDTESDTKTDSESTAGGDTSRKRTVKRKAKRNKFISPTKGRRRTTRRLCGRADVKGRTHGVELDLAPPSETSQAGEEGDNVGEEDAAFLREKATQLAREAHHAAPPMGSLRSRTSMGRNGQVGLPWPKAALRVAKAPLYTPRRKRKERKGQGKTANPVTPPQPPPNNSAQVPTPTTPGQVGEVVEGNSPALDIVGVSEMEVDASKMEYPRNAPTSPATPTRARSPTPTPTQRFASEDREWDDAIPPEVDVNLPNVDANPDVGFSAANETWTSDLREAASPSAETTLNTTLLPVTPGTPITEGDVTPSSTSSPSSPLASKSKTRTHSVGSDEYHLLRIAHRALSAKRVVEQQDAERAQQRDRQAISSLEHRVQDLQESLNEAQTTAAGHIEDLEAAKRRIDEMEETVRKLREERKALAAEQTSKIETSQNEVRSLQAHLDTANRQNKTADERIKNIEADAYQLREEKKAMAAEGAEHYAKLKASEEKVAALQELLKVRDKRVAQLESLLDEANSSITGLQDKLKISEEEREATLARETKLRVKLDELNVEGLLDDGVLVSLAHLEKEKEEKTTRLRTINDMRAQYAALKRQHEKELEAHKSTGSQLRDEQAEHRATRTADEGARTQLGMEQTAHQATSTKLSNEQAAHQATRIQLSNEQAAHQATSTQLSDEQAAHRETRDAYERTCSQLAEEQTGHHATRLMLRDAIARIAPGANGAGAEYAAAVAHLDAQLGEVKAVVTEQQHSLMGLRSDVASTNESVRTLEAERNELPLRLNTTQERLASMQTAPEPHSVQISVLKAQISDLKREAGRVATSHADESNRLKRTIASDRTRITDLEHRVADLERRVNEEQAQRENSAVEVERLETEVKRLKRGIEELSSEIRDLEESKKGLKVDKKNLELEVEGLQGDDKSRQREIKKLREDDGDRKVQVQNLQAQIERLKADCKNTLAEAKTLSAKAKYDHNAEVKGLKDKIQDLKQDCEKQNAQVKRLKTEVGDLTVDRNRQLAQVKTLSAEVKARKDEISNLKEEVEGGEVQVMRLNAQLKGLAADRKTSEAKVKRRDTTIKAREDEINDLKEKIIAGDRKLENLAADVKTSEEDRDTTIETLSAEVKAGKDEIRGLKEKITAGDRQVKNIKDKLEDLAADVESKRALVTALLRRAQDDFRSVARLVSIVVGVQYAPTEEEGWVLGNAGNPGTETARHEHADRHLGAYERIQDAREAFLREVGARASAIGAEKQRARAQSESAQAQSQSAQAQSQSQSLTDPGAGGTVPVPAQLPLPMPSASNTDEAPPEEASMIGMLRAAWHDLKT